MSDLYEVEAILLSRPASIKSRQRKGSVRVDKLPMDEKEYFIKWKGYSILESTWEPYSNLANVKALVAEFCNHDEKLLAKIPNYKQMIHNPQFACEALTDKRKMGDKWEYLVKWKDFQQETWEAAENLPEEAIDKYNDSYNDDNDALLSGSALDHTGATTSGRGQDNDFGADDFHANDNEEEQKQTDRESTTSSPSVGNKTAPKSQQKQKQESTTNGGSASNKRKLDDSAMLEVNDTETPLKKKRSSQSETELSSGNASATTTPVVTSTQQHRYPTIPSDLHLTGQEEVEVAMLRKFERKVVKVTKDADGTLCVRATSPEGKEEKFSLNAFKAVYPHQLVDYFLRIIKFGSNKSA